MLSKEIQMGNGVGMNGPIVLLTFLGGLGSTATHAIAPLVGSLVVGLLLKCADWFLLPKVRKIQARMKRAARRRRVRLKQLQRERTG